MPEPILVSIAAALAGKAATGLWDLVRGKFSGNEKAIAELEAAGQRPDDQERINALAERLDAATADDPAFAEELQAHWQQVNTQNVTDGTFANQFSGNVGKNVQINTVQGDVNL